MHPQSTGDDGKKGKAAHVRGLVRPMAEQGDAPVLLQALNDEPSYLFLALQERKEEERINRDPSQSHSTCSPLT